MVLPRLTRGETPYHAHATLAWALVFLWLIACLPQALAKGIEPETGRITLSLAQEPPSLDTSLAEDTTSAFILGLTNGSYNFWMKLMSNHYYFKIIFF